MASLLIFSIFLLSVPTLALTSECFACMSGPDWSYYTARIQGLKQLSNDEKPPLAPMSCVFDPMKTYADRSQVKCDGKCFKWSSAKIQSDGGIEVFMLRGCFNKLVNTSINNQPTDGRLVVEDIDCSKGHQCYQSPDHYSHQIGVEYISQCFCNGFMCNSTLSLCFNYFSSFLLITLALFIRD